MKVKWRALCYFFLYEYRPCNFLSKIKWPCWFLSNIFVTLRIFFRDLVTSQPMGTLQFLNRNKMTLLISIQYFADLADIFSVTLWPFWILWPCSKCEQILWSCRKYQTKFLTLQTPSRVSLGSWELASCSATMATMTNDDNDVRAKDRLLYLDEVQWFRSPIFR